MYNSNESKKKWRETFWPNNFRTGITTEFDTILLLDGFRRLGMYNPSRGLYSDCEVDFLFSPDICGGIFDKAANMLILLESKNKQNSLSFVHVSD